ncbi:hypothetical protein KZ686_14400 [Cupriavidus cauae]|uniref:hypothetical protein n=1 Tax=Cupriavidus cauae TaxID=2608999 RepID=UPI0022430918|nr:hypothetical protein [Cupriavidus cauae]UZN48905.1 hypothetical protein KZ686_14400 [Cupriavidus cauae]
MVGDDGEGDEDEDEEGDDEEGDDEDEDDEEAARDPDPLSWRRRRDGIPMESAGMEFFLLVG